MDGDNTQQTSIQSIPWYQSDAMRSAFLGLATAIAAAVVGLLSMFGITLDPEFQGKLIAGILALYAVMAGGLHVWSIYSRLNTSTVIQGSKAEKTVTAQGGTVTPKTPS